MELHPYWEAFPEMQNRLKKVSNYIAGIVDETPVFIRTELEQILLTPGKMLRPAFVLMSAADGDELPDYVYQVAAAVELLHTVTLIHDDIIDQSPSRRNKPSLHINIGVKRAVLAGDYLLARTLELASSAHVDVPVSELNRGISRLCLSEIEQDSDIGNFFIDRNTYLNRINGKTAELFALSCMAGAVLGGREKKTCDKYHELGRVYGTAFQIYDDLLDYCGIPGEMGKPTGNDLKEGIATLPLIIALESGDQKLARLCRSRFRYRFRGRIRKIVIDGNYDAEAAKVGLEYRDECLKLLAELQPADYEVFETVIKKLDFGMVSGTVQLPL